MTDELDPAETALAELNAGPDKWPSGAARGIQKTHYTHDALADAIIANPLLSQNQLADMFGYTPGWISQILASDAFQTKLAERTAELVDPTIRATVEDRFKGMILRSLDILQQKLNRPAAAVPDNLALRSLELSSRAMGYGARDPAPAVPPVEMHLHLEQLGEGLTKLLHRRKAEVIESTSTEIPHEVQVPAQG